MTPSIWYMICYMLFYAPVQLSFTVAHAVLIALFPSLRPFRTWTFRQVLMTRILRCILGHLSALQYAPSLSLEPGSEGFRFEIIPTGDATKYKGPLIDTNIQPQPLGGTWTPKRPTIDPSGTNDARNIFVMLHMHGGAYVVGDGRDHDTGFLAKTLLNQTPCTHIFTPQYRLSSLPKGRFPAALQDALSSYIYLLEELHIPPHCIVFSGDSAGGNLALSLLHYVANFGKEVGLPLPAAILLWSPWCDVASAHDTTNLQSSTNYHIDFLPASFAEWGYRAVTGKGQIDGNSPYLTFTEDGVITKNVPIWVQTGGNEALFDDNHRFVDSCRKSGAHVEWDVDLACPHDVMLMGDKLGFASEAQGAAAKAGQFLRRVISEQ